MFTDSTGGPDGSRHPKARPFRKLSLTVLLALGGLSMFASAANADSLGPITFESPTYNTGAIHNQDGWTTGTCAAYDHEVDTNTFGHAAMGSQVLRMSNAVTSGCFDATFSKSLGDEAGEASAENGGNSGGTRQPYFTAEWQFASTLSTYQQDLSVVASPDRGDGARMSWVQMTDTLGGLAVNFFDYQADGTPGDDNDFIQSPVATGLDRAAIHTIRIEMEFVPGVGNDIVRVFVDGQLGHTGTSWEDYFRLEESNPTRTVDSILFRTGGAAATGTAGNGFAIDGLSLASSAVPVVTTPPTDGAGGVAGQVAGKKKKGCKRFKSKVKRKRCFKKKKNA